MTICGNLSAEQTKGKGAEGFLLYQNNVLGRAGIAGLALGAHRY